MDNIQELTEFKEIIVEKQIPVDRDNPFKFILDFTKSVHILYILLRAYSRDQLKACIIHNNALRIDIYFLNISLFTSTSKKLVEASLLIEEVTCKHQTD
jgi:hypothetical protein